MLKSSDASIRNCKGDITAFRPSIVVGVPAVWGNIRKGILAKVHAGVAIKTMAFDTTMALKRRGTLTSLCFHMSAQPLEVVSVLL